MALRRVITTLNKPLLLQEKTTGLLASVSPTINAQFVRHRRTKHWNPKWKMMRRFKVMRVDLPNYNENIEDLTEEEIRSKMKEQGILPPRSYNEREFFISSTGSTFEPYIPPEGDGKVSILSTKGTKQGFEFLEKKARSMMSIRKIKQFDEEFESASFCKEATEIYLKMHELMADRDKEGLIKYVTERAYPEVIYNTDNKTIHWKYIKDVELPRIVHARHTEVITKENIFAQVTVRFHTQQILAIYDRFGRLMHGSEIVAKDVLEYVVFEKHLSNEYGLWRVHDKIIPTWQAPKEPSSITLRKPVEKSIDPTVVPHDVESPKLTAET